jgi:hypothetical protein
VGSSYAVWEDKMSTENSDSIIKLQRTRQYVGCLYKTKIFLDGTLIGRIRNDEINSFTVTPGLHAIHVRMTGYQSNTLKIELEPGTEINLVCGMSKWCSYMWLIPFIVPLAWALVDFSSFTKFKIGEIVIMMLFLVCLILLIPVNYLFLKKVNQQ